ncbi:unnamed protein product, partial [marine sediment metagenome]
LVTFACSAASLTLRYKTDMQAESYNYILLSRIIFNYYEAAT